MQGGIDPGEHSKWTPESQHPLQARIGQGGGEERDLAVRRDRARGEREMPALIISDY